MKSAYAGYTTKPVTISPVLLSIISVPAGGLIRTVASDVEVRGLAKQRREMQENPAALMQAHFSYLDTVITPYVLREEGISHPYIATGKNLLKGFTQYIAPHAGMFPIDRELLATVAMWKKLQREGKKDDAEQLKSQLPQVKAYKKGLEAFVHDALDEAPVMFYPGATRSRDGRADYTPDTTGKGKSLSIIGDMILNYAQENAALRIWPSAVTYEWNPDIEEFQNGGEHRGAITTFSSYLGHNKPLTWLSALHNGIPGWRDLPLPRPHVNATGKVIVNFGNPIHAEQYLEGNSRRVADLANDVYDSISDLVCITSTSLAMTAMERKAEQPVQTVLDTMDSLASHFANAQMPLALSGTEPKEMLDYAEHLLAPHGALRVSSGRVLVNAFARDYLSNTIEPHLQKAGLLDHAA